MQSILRWFFGRLKPVSQKVITTVEEGTRKRRRRRRRRANEVLYRVKWRMRN